MSKNNKLEIISEEEIYEPTGEFQESGREVIFTSKIVAKRGKITITLKSNEPSPEAKSNFNSFVNQIAREIVDKQILEDYKNRNE